MPRRKKIDEPLEEIKKIKTPPLVKGEKDILPTEVKYWNYLFEAITNLAHDFRFVHIDTPTMERYDLYAHCIGKNHEYVKKGLINFQDRNEKISLRADYTPGVARSFIEHSIYNQPAPYKFWYLGNVFLQEKLGLSKYRELTQAGFEVYGAKSPSVDAELIMILCQTFNDMGFLPHIKVNSLGCLACRAKYAKALGAFIKSKRSAVCADCRAKSTREPMRFLTCVSQKCQKAVEDAPQIVDYLCDRCHDHLFKVLENLDELNVDYILDAKLISDFNYYNSTYFEIYNRLPEEEKKQQPDENFTLLAQGGRMDYLIEMLSGPETEAVGVKFYLEKIISEMKDKKIEVPKTRAPQVYFAQISEQAKREAMRLIADLRKQDFRVMANFSKDSLKSQLDSANKLGAKVILILGQKEVNDSTIIIRDTASGIQEVINQKKIISEIKKKLCES